MNEKLLVTVCMNAQSSDIVEELLRCHDVVHQLGLTEEVVDIVAVSKEELQSLGVRRLHRLAHVDEVDVTIVPEHVVLAQVGMNEAAFGIHSLHSLWVYMHVRSTVSVVCTNNVTFTFNECLSDVAVFRG